MPSWLETVVAFLFKYRPYAFQKGHLALSAAWPLRALALLGLAAALAVALGYGRARGKASPRQRALLAGLRLAAAALVLLCPCRPVLRVATVVPQQSFLGVLIDDSKSMRIAGEDGRPRSAFALSAFGPEGPLLKRLSDRFKVRFFRFASTAERMPGASGLGFEGSRSHVAEALDRAREELSSLPLSGLVLVTDGADNGEGPLTESLLSLKARGIPVFAVGLGRERYARDIEVTRVEAPRSALKGTSLVVDVAVSQRGFSGQTVQLLVEDAGRIVASQDVELPSEGESVSVRAHVAASEAGPRSFRFRIVPKAGEELAENNAQDVLVEVVDRREKVLYFEGEPRFELKFLRRAVSGDENLQVVTLQRTAQDKFLRLDVDNAEELAAGFPKTREELYRYRGLVLGSVEASFFTADQLRMVSDFVSQRGGGLLMLGGRRSFAEGGYAPTPLADVLPVVLEAPAGGPNDERRQFQELKVEPTPSGVTHAAMQLGATEAESRKRWQTLPPLSALNPVHRIKPGAVTLLAGRAQGSGEAQVVLAHQRYGRGKALAFTVQDSWLWQMHADIPLEDLTHETLWRQLLRWLVSQVPGPVTATTPRDRYAPGESVLVTAEVDDDRFLRVNDARVVAHLKTPSGATRDLPMEWTVDRDGEYRASFRTEEAGLYEVRVEARRGESELGNDLLHVQAADLPTEYFASEMRAPLLRRVADETGGRFYTAATASGLPDDIGYSGTGSTVVEEKELWDAPAAFLAVVLLLAAEWILRRRWGLA
jgi:uncharacterized membrane protein